MTQLMQERIIIVPIINQLVKELKLKCCVGKHFKIFVPIINQLVKELKLHSKSSYKLAKASSNYKSIS